MEDTEYSASTQSLPVVSLTLALCAGEVR